MRRRLYDMAAGCNIATALFGIALGDMSIVLLAFGAGLLMWFAPASTKPESEMTKREP